MIPVSVSPFGVRINIFTLWKTTWPILHVESTPLCHAELSVLSTNVARMCIQAPPVLFQGRKWNTHLASSTREMTSGMQYRMKWGVFLVNLESWLGSQIQKVQGGGKKKQKKNGDKNSPEAEGEHMLMHNHNVQYPNLRDYRKIEQWQGHRSIPITAALCIIS